MIARIVAVLMILSVALAYATAQELSGTSGNLGTPGTLTLTNATGLPVSTGISGLGTGVATALAVAVGSAGAPVVLNGALGTPSSGTLSSATGLPISTGVSGLGTGVATALAVNTGSAGAALVNGGIDTTSHVNTATISKTDTTLSTGSITGVSQALTASGLYVCDGFIHFTTAPGAGNGAKVALATSDTLTVNTLTFFVTSLNGAAFVAAGTGTATALAAAPVTPTAAMTDILLKAVINVNAAGTLQLQLAESTASGTIAATAGNVGWVCHRAA